MPIKHIELFKSPILKKRSRDVIIEAIFDDTESANCISDLRDTFHEVKNKALGLAANQIGYAINAFAINTSILKGMTEFNSVFVYKEVPDCLIFINPTYEVVPKAKVKANTEGCLSFPNTPRSIRRPQEIQINTYVIDLDGELQYKSFIATDLLAIVFQHETDHLFGRTIV